VRRFSLAWPKRRKLSKHLRPSPFLRCLLSDFSTSKGDAKIKSGCCSSVKPKSNPKKKMWGTQPGQNSRDAERRKQKEDCEDVLKRLLCCIAGTATILSSLLLFFSSSPRRLSPSSLHRTSSSSVDVFFVFLLLRARYIHACMDFE